MLLQAVATSPCAAAGRAAGALTWNSQIDQAPERRGRGGHIKAGNAIFLSSPSRARAVPASRQVIRRCANVTERLTGRCRGSTSRPERYSTVNMAHARQDVRQHGMAVLLSTADLEVVGRTTAAAAFPELASCRGPRPRRSAAPPAPLHHPRGMARRPVERPETMRPQVKSAPWRKPRLST